MLESNDPAQAWTAVKGLTLHEVALLNDLLDARDEARALERKRDRERKERGNG